MFHQKNYSIKVYFKPNMFNDGAIYIQTIINRKKTIKATGITCSIDNFNKDAINFKWIGKADKNHVYKNQQILFKLKEIEASLQDANYEFGKLNFDIAKIAIENKFAKIDTLLAWSKRYVEQIKLSAGTKRRYQAIINKNIEKHFKTTSLVAINARWLTQAEQIYLSENYNTNTIWAIFKFIRSVLNYAMDKGIELDYPFGAKKGLFKMPKYTNPERNFLTTEQIESIKYFFDSVEPMKANVCRWFMFQIYSGLRYSDLNLKENLNIIENRIYIQDKKTKAKHYIKIYPKLKEAIDNLPSKLYTYDVYNRTLKQIGIDLKIKFKLTTHVARHTFATQYLNAGGSYEVLKPLMGITQDKTVRIYGKITDDRIDSETDRILG